MFKTSHILVYDLRTKNIFVDFSMHELFQYVFDISKEFGSNLGISEKFQRNLWGIPEESHSIISFNSLFHCIFPVLHSGLA